MSIDVQSAIWQTCLYSGGTLNVLLSMADFAGLDGRDIFPGLDYLAARCRQTPRATQDCIKRLRADKVVVLLGASGKDLEPDANPTGGRGNRTEYRIDLKRVQELQALHQAEEPNCLHCLKGRKPAAKRVKISATKGEVFAAKGEENDGKGEVSRTHIDNHQEPSIEPSVEPPAAAPPAPGGDRQSSFPGFEPNAQPFEIPSFLRTGNGVELDAAYDAYNEVATTSGWTVCQRRTAQRDARLRKRIRDAGGLDGWKIALAKGAASDFICGRVAPRDGREPFHADLDFFLQESRFTSLMEGKYDNRTGPTNGNGPGGRSSRLGKIAQAASAAIAAGARPH
jgi:hypothetical protein